MGFSRKLLLKKRKEKVEISVALQYYMVRKGKEEEITKDTEKE